MTNKIDFTPEKVEALRRAYDKAIAEGKDQFVFEGLDVLVSYAKYMLEYLDGLLKKGPNG